MHKCTPSGVPKVKIPPEFNLATEKAIHSDLNAQSTFLHTSRYTTAKYLPHSVLDHRCAETTISVSQLQTQLSSSPSTTVSRKISLVTPRTYDAPQYVCGITVGLITD
jgi:hypothetical protein